jgi:uncharacterized membrane-anchored protein YitT (DUF2179 family)
MIRITVSRELVILESFIREIDEHAFMTVFDAKEVLGEGFKPLKEGLIARNICPSQAYQK